jgi:endoglucanase
MVLITVAVAGLGVYFLQHSYALAFMASVEAENGTITGTAAKAADATASAGNAVKFGTKAVGYTVTGNKVYDANGNAHIFHGVARPSLEWSATGENLSLSDYQLMAAWKTNIVRLSLNEKFWLQNTSGYQATIATQVQQINSLGMDVILDLHWSDAGNINNSPAQQIMADQDSNTFWQQVAAAYKGNPKVLFELYNEPHDVSWSIWRNGGSAGGFTVVGMQQLYNTVRATGANNLVVIGGLNWAFDLSGVPANRITGNNIVYATHPYDFSGKNTVADWDAGFGFLTSSDPVIMTEFGDYNCSTTLYTDLLAYAKSQGVSWTGWAWYPGGCGFPSLINDWSGAANAPGQVVKNAM